MRHAMANAWCCPAAWGAGSCAARARASLAADTCVGGGSTAALSYCFCLIELADLSGTFMYCVLWVCFCIRLLLQYMLVS